jgi:AN1-type zinc finger protein 2
MDLNIGKHCANEDCNQLDFLPFECKLCKSFYCSEHRGFVNHISSCPGRTETHKFSATVVLCPVCCEPVNGTSSTHSTPEQINRLVNRHIEEGCPKILIKAKNCTVCRKSNVVPIVCKCGGTFCSRHRFKTDHLCVVK